MKYSRWGKRDDINKEYQRENIGVGYLAAGARTSLVIEKYL